MNNKEKIRMFLPFSWVIPAMISFSYINAPHTKRMNYYQTLQMFIAIFSGTVILTTLFVVMMSSMMEDTNI